MSHPLVEIMAAAKSLLLIGDSDSDRFPAMSYHCYRTEGRDFHCLDLGSLAESRGFTKGGPVLHSLAELPQGWTPDLAVVWLHPYRAAEGVNLAADAGARRIWFSFHTVSEEALAVCKERGVEVVEAGRCPVFYLNQQVSLPCRMHTMMTRLSGAWALPPQTDAAASRRELI